MFSDFSGGAASGGALPTAAVLGGILLIAAGLASLKFRRRLGQIALGATERARRKTKRRSRWITDRLVVVSLLALTAGGCGRGEQAGEPAGEGPAVSRDGQWIVFASIRATGSKRPTGDGLYVAPLGGVATRITDPRGDIDNGIDASPDWSPDRARIAFSRAGESTYPFGPTWKLYVVNADGSKLRRLTGGNDRSPSWSPDGKTIAFERFSFPDSSIHTIDSDGGGERRLLADASDPAWSPDGDKIAFVTGTSLEFPRTGVAVFDLNTKHITTVTAATGVAQSPAWSPDGKRIAFVNTPHDDVNIDGTGLRQLTQNSALDSSPTWAQDGRIVFASDRAGPQRLYIMNADGTRVRSLGERHHESP